jgi:putative transposase
LALEYGVSYHIFTRGNNRENIFPEEQNYFYFMGLFLQLIEPFVETYAYCLLRNHFHLFLRIKEKTELKVLPDDGRNSSRSMFPSPSQRFSNLLNAYAKTVNNTYHRSGSLFQHPFRRISVADESYFAHLIAYIHQNPQHHGFVKDFRDWPYSSYPSLQSRRKKETCETIHLTRAEGVRYRIRQRGKGSELIVPPSLVRGDFL